MTLTILSGNFSARSSMLVAPSAQAIMSWKKIRTLAINPRKKTLKAGVSAIETREKGHYVALGLIDNVHFFSWIKYIIGFRKSKTAKTTKNARGLGRITPNVQFIPISKQIQK